MKTLIKVITIILFFISCKSTNTKITNSNNQENIAIGRITYIYKFKPRKYLLEQEANLYFNDNSSIFITSQGKEPFIIVDGESGQDGFMQDEIGDEIYKNLRRNTINIREKIWNQPYVSSEKMPVFNWTLTKKTKKIGSFTCYLATTNFRGRSYNVWYTKELSFSDGPWKFNGLPGLILEVIDEKMEYQFLFKSIELPTSKIVNIAFNGEGKTVEFQEFKRADDIEFNKQRKQAEAKWDGQGEFKMTKNPANSIELNYD